MNTQLLNKLKNSLEADLPGSAAHRILAPANRELKNPGELKPGEFKPSAVMVLLYKNLNEELFFPLIQRLEYNGVHSGQMALPGGKQELSDAGLEETALRECREEIGANGKIQFLGKLSPLFIPVSGYLVQPFVSFLEDSEPWFTPQASEIQAVYPIKVRDLLNDSNLNRGSIRLKDYSLVTPYFHLENKQVWGATAMILNEMKTVLKSIF